MKKATVIFWVIIIGVIALVLFQNQDFFKVQNAFRINLGLFEEYLSPKIPNAVLVLIFFVSGLVIAHLFNFSARFKAKRTIKRLNASVTSTNKEIGELKDQLSRLKSEKINGALVDGQADTIKLDMNATQKIGASAPAENNAAKTMQANPADEALKNIGKTKEQSKV